MTAYEIVADTARTFALRNVETGQFDQTGFASRAAAVRTFNLHFGWDPNYRLISGSEAYLNASKGA
jgi:hypothetical protein